MRRKRILIGLFVLIIYRTIEEPKNLQGGRERAFVTMHIFRPVLAGTGVWGVVFRTAGFGRHGSQRVKIQPRELQVT